MSNPQTTLGQLITGTIERDAVHIAVAPVVAAHVLIPGEAIGFLANDQETVGRDVEPIGIVDPFLKASVRTGQRFWMFLYPNTITSLNHVWSHPAFSNEPKVDAKAASERWMRDWAVKHMGCDYYGDGEKRSPELAYADAIEAGHSHRVGPYEDARDHIDSEWWSHWETITGQHGDREEYFSCAC